MSRAQLIFRRCHVCGSINEAENSIRRCTSCTKAFAPFFYFNDADSPILTEGELRPPSLTGERLPIHGLTAYWQNDEF